MSGQNYFTCNALSFDDVRIFMNAGLHTILDRARAALFKQKTSNFYIKLEHLSHSDEELDVINAHISYILELIGEHSNGRWGNSAPQQHTFFASRPQEHEAFFLLLFMAIQKHKQLAIPNAYDMPAPYIKDAHLELKKREKTNTQFFTVNGILASEKQLYAAGVFYAIGFAFDAVRAGDALRTSKIMSRILHFMSGPSYLAAYGSKGGSRDGKAKRERDTAYDIFKNEDLYKKCNGKVTSIAEALIPLLEAEKITRSLHTIEKTWVPEFIKRQKASQ